MSGTERKEPFVRYRLPYDVNWTLRQSLTPEEFQVIELSALLSSRLRGDRLFLSVGSKKIFDTFKDVIFLSYN